MEQAGMMDVTYIVHVFLNIGKFPKVALNIFKNLIVAINNNNKNL
jgi:hypothetical protein